MCLKNKLIGRIIGECTSIINETMMNNRDNEDNDNTIANIFIGIFSIVIFTGIVCFCVLIFLSALKIKNYLKRNILIIKIAVDVVYIYKNGNNFVRYYK